MGKVDLEALKRLGLNDPEDLEEELAEIGLQLPAIIAALERISELERDYEELRYRAELNENAIRLLKERAERVEAAAREHIAAIERVTKPGERVSPSAATLRAALASASSEEEQR